MCVQRILPGLGESTSLLESEAGPRHCATLDGQATSQSGVEVAHASHSPQPESVKVKRTKGTSGQRCSVSSKAVDRPSWLGSRSLKKLESLGSMEFVTTWKELVTPAGRTIWRQVASARRTDDSGSTGLASWATPMAGDTTGGKIPPSLLSRASPCKLKQQVQLAPWDTPTALSAVGRKPGNNRYTNMVTAVVPWATPMARDCKGKAGPKSTFKDLNKEVQIAPWDTPQASWAVAGATSRSGDRKDEMLTPGVIRSSCHAQTGRSGVLAPEFSRWLMAYPEAWDQHCPHYSEWVTTQNALEQLSRQHAEVEPADCEATAMPSCPMSPPSS